MHGEQRELGPRVVAEKLRLAFDGGPRQRYVTEVVADAREGKDVGRVGNVGSVGRVGSVGSVGRVGSVGCVGNVGSVSWVGNVPIVGLVIVGIVGFVGTAIGNARLTAAAASTSPEPY